MKLLYNLVSLVNTKEILVKLFLNKGKDDIEKRYSQSFYQYHRHLLTYQKRGSFDRFLRTIVQIRASLRKKQGNLLDAGCGYGLRSMILSKLGYKIFSLDISLRMLKVHNLLISDCDKKMPCYPIWGDAVHLPFKDQSVDIVYANEFISHVPDLSKSMMEFSRVLKPEGEIIISDTDRFFLFSILALLSRRSAEKRYRAMRKEIIKQFLKKRGYRLEENEINDVASKTKGLVKQEIEKIVCRFLDGNDIENIINKFKRREPFHREFKYRSPYGQYQERLFTPSEVVKLLKNNFSYLEVVYPIVWFPLSYFIGYRIISTLERILPNNLSTSFLTRVLIGKYVIHGIKK